MRMRRSVVAGMLVAAGCGGRAEVDSPAEIADAGTDTGVDAAKDVGTTVDAHAPDVGVDAAVDAAVDAPPVDAPGPDAPGPDAPGPDAGASSCDCPAGQVLLGCSRGRGRVRR